MELLLLTLAALIVLFIFGGLIEIAVRKYEEPRKKVIKNRNRKL